MKKEVGWEPHNREVGPIERNNACKSNQVLYTVRACFIERLVLLDVVVHQCVIQSGESYLACVHC